MMIRKANSCNKLLREKKRTERRNTKQKENLGLVSSCLAIEKHLKTKKMYYGAFFLEPHSEFIFSQNTTCTPITSHQNKMLFNPNDLTDNV